MKKHLFIVAAFLISLFSCFTGYAALQTTFNGTHIGDGAGLTNLTLSSITNFPSNLATTNYVNTATNGLVTSSITNGLATTNYVNSITNGLATTNYAKSVTNNFTTLVYTNPSSILYTSSLPALTNGFVTSSITNGLATTNYANSVTNNFTSLVYTNPSSILYTSSLPALTNGFVTSSITNGLATTNFVLTQILATNSANLTITTNLVIAATNNFTTLVYSNPAIFLYTNALPGLTNGFVTSSITNGLATTNYVNAATNGLVTSSITNGLATTNYVNAATNGLVTSSVTNGLATTNYVLTQISATNTANLTITTNLVVAATNNFTTLVYSNPAVFLYTNALPGLTNGFVTSSITNGLATTNYANSLTNNFTTLVYTNPSSILYTSSLPGLTNGFVTSSITNGLASTNYVLTQITSNGIFGGVGLTNGVVYGNGSSLTNLSLNNATGTNVTMTNLNMSGVITLTNITISNPVFTGSGSFGGVGMTNASISASNVTAIGTITGNGSGLTNTISAYNGKDSWTNQLVDQSISGTNLTASTYLSLTLTGVGVWDVTCYAALDGGATGGSACNLFFNISALVTGTCLSGYEIGTGFLQPGIQSVGWPSYSTRAFQTPSYTQQYSEYYFRCEVKTTNTTTVTLYFAEKSNVGSVILKANSSISAKFIR